ncbi:MAG TPA: YbjN domain-containing protein [Propionibacteriaceae bacterium]|nr:YbjN domain-containing protein [Propionibacteriaceae bacterium]
MPRDAGAGQHQAIEIIDSALAALGLEVLRPSEDLFAVRLPGTRKLVTECVLQVGVHGVSIRAFVARNPDENHEAVYRWLLQRNLKLYGVAFTLDSLGDIYLTGRIALESVSAAEVDRLLGAVAETADSSFNPILELGFAESIQREWAWRRSRGEPTWNLAAFRQFDPGPPDPGPPDPGSGGSEPPDPKARR